MDFVPNRHLFSLLKIVFLFVVSLKYCFCFNPKFLNVSNIADAGIAGATWYGPPAGAGSDGGACSYGIAVEQPPLNKLITATGPSLFRSGQNCGSCYQVTCLGNAACSKNPVIVTVTDECPGCPDAAHFDLSGTAFSSLALPGKGQQLRNAGQIKVQYKRVPCSYPGVHIAFNVQPGSNPFYIATAIEFVNQGGHLSAVSIKPAGGSSWFPMRINSGTGVWSFNSASGLKPPLSFKLTESLAKKTLIAQNVIPVNWKAGTYRSLVNFA